jgi:tRNA 2-(methylsulfanyl)-N6-isopentenyladenosine37 hydroxylase
MLCLKVPTDAAWAGAAMGDLDAVLIDHAHCEMKAASNALSLAARHPGDAELAMALTSLAREEIEHFQRVLAMLVERGVTLGPPPVDAYAAELRKAAGELPREHHDGSPLVDRLLVSALIEARSCERFKLLAEATAAEPARASEHALWSELLAAEARHYRTFVDLAARAAGGDRARVEARLDAMADAEAKIVTGLAKAEAQASRAAIHG